MVLRQTLTIGLYSALWDPPLLIMFTKHYWAPGQFKPNNAGQTHRRLEAYGGDTEDHVRRKDGNRALDFLINKI